jgi:ubiquitin carboxyl-terminal hydrolase 22/27/51
MLTRVQRFEYKQGRNERAAKIDTPVQFPLQLNMLPYTNRARGQDVRENYELARSCTYDLLSVVVHVGEIDTGHYVSYCRVGDQVCVPSLLSPGSDRADCEEYSGLRSTTTRWSWRRNRMCSTQGRIYYFMS